jgi:hypothetical protein
VSVAQAVEAEEEITEPLPIETLRALPLALMNHHLEMMVHLRRLTPKEAVRRYLAAASERP